MGSEWGREGKKGQHQKCSTVGWEGEKENRRKKSRVGNHRLPPLGVEKGF